MVDSGQLKSHQQPRKPDCIALPEISLSDELRSIQNQIVVINDSGIDMSWSIHDIFTARACDELAVKLAEAIPDGDIIHVRARLGASSDFLVHAGVLRDDFVYDVEGVHDVDDWVERWSRGLDVEIHFRDPLSERRTFASSQSEVLAGDVADALMGVPEFAKAGISLALL